ncbi:MAG: nuclear transport factor 2 family protein [Xanthomonadales bacterium]|nr:nuclear transport factor 2 family protein [Xanthomonadales bacterium]
MTKDAKKNAVELLASQPPSQSPAAARREVVQVLQLYFDALHEADATKMDRIFHAQGIYATADEHPTLTRDKRTYLDVLRNRESPQSRGDARKDHIDSIEFAGANTARARVRCSIGSSDFVDFLTLIRDEEGQWQIISKIFQIV